MKDSSAGEVAERDILGSVIGPVAERQAASPLLAGTEARERRLGTSFAVCSSDRVPEDWIAGHERCELSLIRATEGPFVHELCAEAEYSSDVRDQLVVG